MKVALVYDAIYPFITGGGEKRFYELGKRLALDGYEIHMYGMKFWKGPKVIQRERMYLHGICNPKKLYNENGRRSIFQSLYFGVNSLKLFWGDFDAIDCSNFPFFSLFACKLVSVFKRKKLYSTWHEVWGKDYWRKYLGYKGFIGYFIERMASKMPDKIIAVSEDTKDKLITRLNVPKEKIIVIPNGIDLKAINQVKKTKKLFDIIYAGRLIAHKNVDFLIRSVRLLANKNPKIKCVIIGDGPEKKRLIKLVEQLKLKNNVLFLGFVSDINKLYSLIKSSKLFVLLSTREGFGIAVIEANALGIPVLTVNHPENAARYLIKPGSNGLICELKEKIILEKISILLKKKNLGVSCYNCAKDFDWSIIVGKLSKVYSK